MNKKEFALKTISPYYKDNSLCAIEGAKCKYLTENGRKCVFGQFLKEYHIEYEGRSAHSLLTEFGEDILVDEAKNMLSIQEWNDLQQMHDAISRNETISYWVEKLGLFTLEELQNYNL